MKQLEKLDLILKTLHTNQNSTIEDICETQNIPLNSIDEIQILAKRLEDENYIRVFATITSYGIEYCEENLSFPRSNSSKITLLITILVR
ncbi:hypothetical protein [Chryseobacterium sp. MP_3.2]|uniref:hypothetical protein n=1 Tax=Chryseobacterium sp. MP_3.2 TaxID=3071712 RepID=UPI002E0250C0|nr:hypothetical protein [Chryseobacterium sp. MP_3.2]